MDLIVWSTSFLLFYFTTAGAQIMFLEEPVSQCNQTCESNSSVKFDCIVFAPGRLLPQAWRVTTNEDPPITHEFNSTVQNVPPGLSFSPPGANLPDGLTVANVSGKNGYKFLCIGYDLSQPGLTNMSTEVMLEVAEKPMGLMCSPIGSCDEQGVNPSDCTFSVKCDVMTASCAGNITINSTTSDVSSVVSSCDKNGRCDVTVKISNAVQRKLVFLTAFNLCGGSSAVSITAPQSGGLTTEEMIFIGVLVPAVVIIVAVVAVIVLVVVIFVKHR